MAAVVEADADQGAGVEWCQQPGMAIAQTTYATDASSEIQALGQLLEAVAL